MHCKSCIQTRNGPDWRSRLAHLQEELYCDGCRTQHPRFLFFPENIESHLKGCGLLSCVGRMGQVTLCSHNTPATTTTWGSIEVMKRTSDWTCWSVCTHSSHHSLRSQTKIKELPAYPRMMGSSMDGCSLTYGWDLPLLDVSQQSVPTLEMIQKALVSLVERGFDNHRVCKHISRGGYLRSFVASSVCQCFSTPCKHLNPFSTFPGQDCLCERQTYLNCKDCGAIYAWFLRDGHVALMHRYVWDIYGPTTAAWLSLLNEDSYRGKLFTENTRHVLCCDTPRCAVGNGRRWEGMAKMNMANYPVGANYDYKEAESRSRATGYQSRCHRMKPRAG